MSRKCKNILRKLVKNIYYTFVCVFLMCCFSVPKKYGIVFMPYLFLLQQ